MKHSLFLMLLSSVFLSSCALQQDVNSLHNHLVALSRQNTRLEQRVTEMDQRTADLGRQLDVLNQRILESEQRSSSALQDNSARMTSRIEEAQKVQVEDNQRLREQLAGLRAMLTDIRQEMQALSGKAEVADHLLKRETQAAADLEKKFESRLSFVEESTSRYQDRLSRLEQYLHLDPSMQKVVSKKAVDSPADRELSDERLYALSKQSFDRGEHETAMKGFLDLLQKHPQSDLANNAQFWVGEIYYREKWYEKAILEYQKVIENYPQGAKVPAALLKQGFAFVNIGDPVNARIILREVIKKYPESSEAKIAENKLNEIK